MNALLSYIQKCDGKIKCQRALYKIQSDRMYYIRGEKIIFFTDMTDKKLSHKANTRRIEKKNLVDRLIEKKRQYKTDLDA